MNIIKFNKKPLSKQSLLNEIKNQKEIKIIFHNNLFTGGLLIFSTIESFLSYLNVMKILITESEKDMIIERGCSHCCINPFASYLRNTKEIISADSYDELLDLYDILVSESGKDYYTNIFKKN